MGNESINIYFYLQPLSRYAYRFYAVFLLIVMSQVGRNNLLEAATATGSTNTPYLKSPISIAVHCRSKRYTRRRHSKDRVHRQDRFCQVDSALLNTQMMFDRPKTGRRKTEKRVNGCSRKN